MGPYEHVARDACIKLTRKLLELIGEKMPPNSNDELQAGNGKPMYPGGAATPSESTSYNARRALHARAEDLEYRARGLRAIAAQIPDGFPRDADRALVDLLNRTL